MTITSDQCRAARALIRWNQDQLHEASMVAKRTIADFENNIRQPHPRTLRDLKQCLEDAGVLFLDADDQAGTGVRLAHAEEVD